MAAEVIVSKPVNKGVLLGLIERYKEMAQEGVEKAAELRVRIVKGETILEKELPEEQRREVAVKLDGLREELREAEWSSTLSTALISAYATVMIMSAEGAREGWKPPAGSVLRMTLPGVCDVSAKLDES